MDISLEQLQQDWQQLDRKVDNLLQVNNTILARLIASRQTRVAKKYSVFLTIDFLLNSFLYLITLRYLGSHFGQWSLFLPVLSFHLLITLSVVRIIWVMHSNTCMDWQLPVVDVKRRYARIGQVTRQFALCVFAYFTLMHTPLLFWLVEEFSGYNMYVDPDSIISKQWVISQWFFTTAIGIAALVALTKYRNHSLLKKLISQSAGFAFLQVEKELNELDEFEREN